MQTKRIVRWGIPIVILVGGAICTALILNSIPHNPNKPGGEVLGATLDIDYAGVRAINEKRYGVPIRLIIPGIHVDSFVENVGLTSSGTMDAPKDLAAVGWFTLGKRPGEKGSAVIAGHYGKSNGVPAVFDTLHTLHVGDTLSVEDEHGTITSFVIRKFQSYSPNDDTAEVFHSNDGKAHLNLITCEGVWNTTTREFSKRLVVFTDRV